MGYMDTYEAFMDKGWQAMMDAASEESQSHSSVETLGRAMHERWTLAAEHFASAAQAVPTANTQWATAVEMLLLAQTMLKRYPIQRV